MPLLSEQLGFALSGDRALCFPIATLWNPTRALSQNLWARSEENRFGGSPNRKYSEREFCEERVRFALLSINRVGFGHCQGKPCGLASLGLDSDRTPP